METSYAVLYADAMAEAAAGRFERAVALYDAALSLDPTQAEGYYKRGNALRHLGRLDAALANYDQAIERRPDHAFAFCNRGVVLQALGANRDALDSYDRALSFAPGDALAHSNRGLLLQAECRWDDALDSFSRAVRADPAFADAQYNLGLALLFRGDFAPGWRGYEWRWKNPHRLGIGELRQFEQPLWLGQYPIAGKRVLLHSEAGLGDTIQFCRYATLVAARGATVYLEVQRPLLELMATLQGVTAVLATGDALPEFDYHCPLMSLPLAFDTTLASVPAPVRYLSADPQTVADRLAKLPPRDGRPRIGIGWSGNPNNPIDARRGIPLADMMTRLPPHLQYCVLQKDLRPADAEALQALPDLVPFAEGSTGFAYTAALCDLMDVNVTVDTSVAHLSAALGKKTWILVPYAPDWRWMLDRNDSPWYPTVKLYRQRTPGDWAEVLDRVAADLAVEVARL